ncbi:MAG: hypothetical protein AAFX06_03455 [Planctomycetota bacterium]
MPLRFRKPVAVLLVLSASMLLSATADAGPPSLLKIFGKAKPIEEVDSFLLKQEDGPWLLLATTFVGQNAKDRAERTAIELRKKLRLPAFIHKQDFDFTGSTTERANGIKRVRYANPHHYEAYAVLVGEYDSVNHGNVDRDLDRLKRLDLDVFRDADEVLAEYNTKSPASTVKAISRHLFFKSKKGAGTKGALATAFVTRNPLLPEDYFQQPEVDSFVRQLNEGRLHSLLDSEGKFTVIVRTFDACGTIQGAKNEDKFTASAERMDGYVLAAEKMVKQLRKDGIEAYQYHDRVRSVVTVGSFESLGRELPDGGFEYAPEIRRVMHTYSALNNTNVHTTPGQRGISANHVGGIPYDIQPTPIAIPKAGKRSFYSSKLRLR